MSEFSSCGAFRPREGSPLRPDNVARPEMPFLMQWLEEDAALFVGVN
jgi:hypothetical protein